MPSSERCREVLLCDSGVGPVLGSLQVLTSCFQQAAALLGGKVPGLETGCSMKLAFFTSYR